MFGSGLSCKRSQLKGHSFQFHGANLQDVFSGVIDLDRSTASSLYRQLYEQLRAAILNGQLTAGTHIPATRAMAGQLGVARNTVLAAVEQLAAEGFLEAKQGSGTVVSARLAPELTRAARVWPERLSRLPALSRSGNALASLRRDTEIGEAPRPFMPGIPDLDAFPRDIWGRLLRRASQKLDPASAAYGATAGVEPFRRVLCEHLREARGVTAEPEQIIIASSAQAALDLLARGLSGAGDTVWIEDPGYLGARAAFMGAGATIIPVPVDRHGLDPSAGTARPKLIYVTPSHQYPTGRLMPLARRLELLECAERHDACIIEDDYDSEFQFQGRPVAALQGLDRSGRVLYVGTFSKILLPGIRVGYAVVPEGLAKPLAAMQRNTGQVVASSVQFALADFIAEGHLRAHVRRMCALYEERQSILLQALNRHFGDQVCVEAPAGGMQFITTFNKRFDDVEAAQKLGEAGIVARPVSQYYLGGNKRQGFLTGFAGYSETAINRAVEKMAKVLGE